MPQPIAHSLFYFLCKFRINTNTSTNPNTNCFPFLRVNKQNEPSRHRQRLGQMFVQKKRREIRKTSRILCRKTGNKRPATRPEPTTPTTTPEKLEEGSTQHQNKNRKLHKHFCILEIVYFKIFCTLAVLFNFAHVETTSGWGFPRVHRVQECQRMAAWCFSERVRLCESYIIYGTQEGAQPKKYYTK